MVEELSYDLADRLNELSAAFDSSGRKLPDDSSFRSELKQVFAFSDFVAKHAIRDPETLDHLIRSGDLQKEYLKMYLL